MQRINWLKHEGVRILRIDFTNCTPAEMMKIIDEAKETVGSEPRGSVRTLTNITNARFNSDVNTTMKNYVAHNKPYVCAAALVGLSGLQRIVYRAVVKFSGRVIRVCDDEASALTWLATTKTNI